MKKHPPIRRGFVSAACLLLGAMGLSCLPAGAAGSFLQDLASGEMQELPTWMEGRPMATPALHATVSFPIKPPVSEEDLLVTVFFNEKPGGFLRVWWDDGFNKEMLCENLAEGTGMLNRRTLLIKRPTLVSSGMLTFQSSEAALGVRRILWQWTRQQPVYLDDSWYAGGFLGRSGEWLKDDEIDGYIPTPRSDYWTGEVVTATISQAPARIEKGVDFVAELPDLPKLARIKVKVSGLPVSSTLRLWLNGKTAGPLQLPVPDLNDPGLQPGKDNALNFIGWREATLLVDVSLLATGENHFQFQAEPAAAALAVKDFDLQLQYP